MRLDENPAINQQLNHDTTSEDYNPAGSQEWQMLDDVESNPNVGATTGTPQSLNGHSTRRQSHVVVKNLIITNANLSNCNVYIQNGGEKAEPTSSQQQQREMAAP